MQEVLQPDLKIGLGKAVKQGGYFWILHVFLLAHLRRFFQRGSGIPAIFKKQSGNSGGNYLLMVKASA